jgi:3,4-dihydroxy-2-butanone 4-phosphate synthase
MTAEQKAQIGPEVILLLRDVATGLICTPMTENET